MKASDIMQLKSETERLQRENPLALPKKTRKTIAKLGDFLRTDLLKRVDSEEPTQENPENVIKNETGTAENSILSEIKLLNEPLENAMSSNTPESQEANTKAPDTQAVNTSKHTPVTSSLTSVTTTSTSDPLKPTASPKSDYKKSLTPKTQSNRNYRALLLKKKQELANKQINNFTDSDNNIKTKTSLLTFDLDDNDDKPASQSSLPNSQQTKHQLFKSLLPEVKKESPNSGSTRTLNMQSILVKRENPKTGTVELVEEHVLLPNNNGFDKMKMEYSGRKVKDLKSCLKTKIHQKKIETHKARKEAFAKAKADFKKDMEDEDEELFDEEDYLQGAQKLLSASQKHDLGLDVESNSTRPVEWEEAEPNDELAQILRGGSTTRTERC